MPGCSTPLFTHAVWPAGTVALLKSPTCPVAGITRRISKRDRLCQRCWLEEPRSVALVAPTAVLLNITGLGAAVGVGNGANGGGGGGVTATTR